MEGKEGDEEDHFLGEEMEEEVEDDIKAEEDDLLILEIEENDEKLLELKIFILIL